MQKKLCFPYKLVNPSAILYLRWHFDFCTAKIGMPQKGLKKVMGLGEAEKTFLKSFSLLPRLQIKFYMEQNFFYSAPALPVIRIFLIPPLK